MERSVFIAVFHVPKRQSWTGKMRNYRYQSDVDYIILTVLKAHKNGLPARDIMDIVNDLSPTKYGPHQLGGRLTKLKHNGYIRNISLTTHVRIWFYVRDNGDLNMLDGDYNRKQLKEMVYDFIKNQPYPVQTVNVANYISKLNGVTYTSHQILGLLFKLQNEGLVTKAASLPSRYLPIPSWA